MDFRLAFRLMQALKRRKLKFDLLDHDAPLGHAETVWFSSELEVVGREHEGWPVAVSLEGIEGSIERALLHVRGVHHIHELIFGIDPGPRPGIAWMGDGVVMGMAQLESLDRVVDHIASVTKVAEHKSTKIRIGDGAPLLRDQIINECIAANLHIEQVNESKTSKGLLRHNHVISAVRIAMIRGERVWEQRDIAPSEGELREIQRQSRKMSNGRKTISAELALAVARGELGLDEALSA
ncbi:MAG: hypothetical protein ACJZ40_06635 [Candidatus Poseidoniaceae archaeon]|jgi:hypothetical protein|tara:strand:+ start:1290 stop:2003 length:714 start_codon:yes stop_codon:yes gene_type:complete